MDADTPGYGVRFARRITLAHQPQPERGTHILLEPQAEHLIAAIGTETQRNVDRIVANHTFIAELLRIASKMANG